MPKFNALLSTQDGIRIFTTTISAQRFCDRAFTKVDMWTPENKKGYQREPSMLRMRRIARYLLHKDDWGKIPRLIPHAILLNCRCKKGDLDFNSTKGELIIPDKYLPLLEVDGQHRLGGLREAVRSNSEMGNYSVPVVIVEGLDKFNEMLQFYILNTTQKRVPTELAQRIIATESENPEFKDKLILERKAWIGRAIEVVDLLNEQKDGLWHRRIKVPGSNSSIDYIVKQATFVQSLEPLLTRSPYSNMDGDEIVELLTRYWVAISDIIPKAFENPENYVTQKGTGVFSMHFLSVDIFDRAREVGKGKITKEAIKTILSRLLKENGAEYWNTKTGEAAKYGTSRKGVRMLANVLQKFLPQQQVEIL